MKQLLLASLFLSLLSTLYSQTTAKIYIVRHAERSAGDDLTPAGNARAIELKRVLGGAGVQRIYSTNTIRTRKTAKPLADFLGLSTNLYPTVGGVISTIKTTGANLRHLVVGHSDTVDDIITQCGCTPPAAITPAMPGTQYDNLFLVLLKKTTVGAVVSWSCEVMQMRYGVSTP